MRSQIKTKERVRQNGEVFTALREINAMLDMVNKEALNIDSTFLEPACGDGNFLAEILQRKMETSYRIAGINYADCEYLATRAFSTIYGVDIMEDNIEESRERLYDNFFASFLNHYRCRPTNICLDSIKFILSQNIQCGDTLSCKANDGSDLMMTKWAFDDNDGLTISIFKYADMVETGCLCTPVKKLPKIPYFMLPAIIQH